MNTVKEFCENLTDIMVDLRFLRGLDENKVYKLKDDLQKLIEEWKDRNNIPKILCGNFMDFYLCAETSALMYNDSEKNKILQWADEISEMMRICVDVKEGHEYDGAEGGFSDGKKYCRNAIKSL